MLEQSIAQRQPPQNPTLRRQSEIARILSSNTIQRQLDAYFGGDGKKMDRFRATMIQLAMSPEMHKWDPLTVVKCGIQVAQIGLSPLPQLKHVYFVPYEGKLQCQIGYVGWIALAERSQNRVKVKSVYDCDYFAHRVDDISLADKVTFRPDYEKREEDLPEWVENNLRGVMVYLEDSEGKVIAFEYVTAKKLKQLKSCSPSVKKKKFSPWTNWPAEMYRAKAIKYVVSKRPMTEQLALAVQLDNELEILAQRASVRRGSEVARELTGAFEEPEVQNETEATNGSSDNQGAQEQEKREPGEEG